MSANVNKPTNQQQKEADVNRKLQLYGIVSAFQNGKVPSNDQIDVALNSFLESKALAQPHQDLSAEGKVLVADARKVVEQAKLLLLSKNEGNLLQDFIYQTTQFDPKAVGTPGAPVDKDTAKRDGDEALQGLRTLGTLLITNGQFRKLLQDATTLLRDMAGDAATNAASKVRPSEEALQTIDQPAQDNTWHEKPDLSKDTLKSKAQNVYGGNAKKDAQDIAKSGADAGGVNQNAPETTDPQSVDKQASAQAAKDTLKNKIDANVDDESKEKIKARNEEYRRKAREYLDKKMPQDRKDQTIWRLKKIVLECQQHPDYSSAIQTLLRLAEDYGKHGRTIGQASAGTAKEARTGFAAAEADLRTLIERFANGTSTEDLWGSIAQIYKDADADSELKDWFKRMDKYVRRCLLEQGYILDDASGQEWDRLYDQGKYLLRDKYRTHTDRVVDEIKFVADQFDQDVQNKAFGDAVQKLFLDLGNDENGKPTFKPHLLKDLSEVIIPGILKNVAYIPIPRIEYTDPQFDVVIENLVLESDNFMPNVTEVFSENYFRWGRKKIANKNKNTIEVKVAGVQMDLRDVSFYVNRKKGFPSIKDTGSVDVLLPGDGFSFKMKVSTADKKDSQHFFKVEKVDVDVKSLNIKLNKSKYKLLFGIFKPLMLKVLRAPMQKAVEKAIKDKCNELDQLFFQVKQEADRALEEAKANPDQAPNIYQRYSDAFQKRVLQGKEKAKAVTEDKKVNMAITKEDSILKDVHLPGGISSKATEYKELARKGDKWESPVFSIGSAKKSTNIPSAPKVEKKPHAAAGTLNGSLNGKAPAVLANGNNPNFTSGLDGLNSSNGLSNTLHTGGGVNPAVVNPAGANTGAFVSPRTVN